MSLEDRINLAIRAIVEIEKQDPYSPFRAGHGSSITPIDDRKVRRYVMRMFRVLDALGVKMGD